MPTTVTQEDVALEFDRVAPSYDRLIGMNPGYRRHLRLSAVRMGAAADARLLDLCCGTGQSTEALREVYPRAHITGMDASSGMLAIAQHKRRLQDCDFREGDAMDPRQAGIAGPFGGIFMAYGIRNMTDPDVCLRRLFDLLLPGGVLCLHEYALIDSRMHRAIWNLVTLGIIIPAGLIASGSTDIYRYLRRSVLDFDRASELEARVADAGYVDVKSASVSGWQRGIVHTFVARRPV